MEQRGNALLQVSEIQLVYRPKVKPSQRANIKVAEDAYKIFLESWDMDSIQIVEHFKIMLLNRTNRVLGVSHISTGGISGTIVDLKILFGIALKGGVCAMILAHNHPSGNLKPSEVNKTLTRKIAEGAKTLDMAVLDHIIVTQELSIISVLH